MWGEKAGIDNSKLIFPKITYGEEVYDQIMTLVDKIDLIVVDSLSAIISKSSITKGVDDSEALALDAKLNTTGLKKIFNGRFDESGKKIWN